MDVVTEVLALGGSLDWAHSQLSPPQKREILPLEDPEVFSLRKKEARKAVVCLVKQCVDKRKMIVLMPLIRGTNLYHMETSNVVNPKILREKHKTSYTTVKTDPFDGLKHP